MPFPFAKMPTLREFINAAVSQGCVEKFSGLTIRGPRGETCPKYLVGKGARAPIAILPDIEDDERLTPAVLSNLVRVLSVRGYEYCILNN